MNREQRRQMGKGQSDERIDVAGIVVHFKNGQYVNLDTSKVTIVDKDTMRPLFEEVLERVPKQVEAARAAVDEAHGESPRQEFADEDVNAYTVTFDTPEGKMEFVKNGNWTGVRKVKE